jgi:signal transduction histidine kinase
MIVTGFVFMWGGLEFAEDGTVSTLGAVGAGALLPLFLWIVVGFPAAALRTAPERAVVGAAVAVWAGTAAWFAVWPVSNGPCETCATEIFPVPPDMPGTEVVGDVAIGLGGLLALLASGLVFRRARRVRVSSTAEALRLVGAASAAIGIILVAQDAGRTFVPALEEPAGTALFAAFMLAPAAFLIGVLRERLSLSSRVTTLVEALGRPMVPGALADAVRRTLGDPTALVGFCVPDRESYVTAAGAPIELPSLGSGRAATFIERGGRRVAVLVHDDALLEDRAALDAVTVAAGAELERLRLEAELRARLVELHESRARVIEAADHARRRIERDLHDGAQQRFVAVAIDLRIISARAKRLAPELSDGLEEIIVELQEALDDLRELARGIHPAALTDLGLSEALHSAASRSRVPVEVLAVADRRLPEQVEVTVYFVVLEALTNASRYADATRATVEVRLIDGGVVVEVRDDGSGGADPAAGSGLRGLADRVNALDGRLEVVSPEGGGTTVTARIPLPETGDEPDRGFPLPGSEPTRATIGSWPGPS